MSKALKLRNLMEFKDRDQVRGLLKLASGQDDADTILLEFIKNAKWSLLGFYEGPILHALIGIEQLEKKQARIRYLSVRPDSQKQGYAAELISMAQSKLKLKAMHVAVGESFKSFFEKLGFTVVESLSDIQGEQKIKLQIEY